MADGKAGQRWVLGYERRRDEKITIYVVVVLRRQLLLELIGWPPRAL